MSWSTMMSWLKQSQPQTHGCFCQPPSTPPLPTPPEIRPPAPILTEVQPVSPVLTAEDLTQLRKDNNNAGPVFAQNAAASIIRAMRIKAQQGNLCNCIFSVRERVFTIGSDGTETFECKVPYKWNKKDAMLVRNRMAEHFPSLLFNFDCVDDICSLYLRPCPKSN